MQKSPLFFKESLAATVERLTFPSGEGGRRKAEAEESSLSYGLQSQRKRQKVKNVPTLKVTKVKKVMKVVKFMYQFDLLMETNGVNEADQKSYLLESVHPDVVHCLLVKGVEVSSPGEMMGIGQGDSSGPILAEAPLGQVAVNGDVGQ